MAKRLLFTSILFTLILNNTKAINLSGIVTDVSGKPLPFVNVTIKGTSTGGSTNEKGFYTLTLPKGEYDILYSYIGYAQQIQKVSILDKNVVLNIVMKQVELFLPPVIISGNDEDPAYFIIREAQKKRKFYLEQIEAYSCDVYIKGLQRMKEMPEKILGFKREEILRDMIGLDSLGRGIIYLSESVSKFNFKQPNHIKEEMISSKVSGDNKAFSYNQASDMLFNFYENTLNLNGMSERGFVSPIASSSFLFYRFKLEGTFLENNLVVDKIKVIPKHVGDPVFSGYIYIVEDKWNIHSIDLLLTKDAQIDFVDSLQVQQLYSPVGNDVWMPVTNKFNFSFGYLGLKMVGYYLGYQDNYVLNPDFPKDYFGPEVMNIAKDANLKDSTYWNNTRPIALTTEEKNDYKLKDSLTLIAESKTYQDSIDKKRNKFKIGRFLLFGYNYSNSYKNYSLNFGFGIFNVSYNTVEGLVFSPSINYNKYFENKKSYNIGGSVRYGFGNNHLNGEVWGSYNFKPQHFSGISLSGGSDVTQFNPNAISPLVNTFYTLFLKSNYMKIYENRYVAARYNSELTNGIYINAGLSYNDRIPLVNSKTWLYDNYPGINFTSNNPQYPDSIGNSFDRNQAVIANIGFTFIIKQRYYTRPNQKVVLGSKYPKFRIQYKKGIGDVDFDFVKAGISKDIDFKLMGIFMFDVSGGIFLNKNKLYFMDYKQFYGNQTIFLSNNNKGLSQTITIGGASNNSSLMGFNLLPYYKYSTLSNFIEAHAEHHFNGAIITKIPLLRKTGFNEVVGFHYLTSKEIKQYVELSVGLEKIGIRGIIPGLIRVDFVTSYNAQTKLTNGFRIGIGGMQ